MRFVFQYTFPIEGYKYNKANSIYAYYISKIQEYIQYYVLKRADFVFPISKSMEFILKSNGVSNLKMMALPMGVNHTLFSPEERKMNIKEAFSIGSSKVILYLGSMDKIRSLEIIFYAFTTVLKFYPNSVLLMVGDGDSKKDLENLSKTLHIAKNVIFTGQVPYSDVPSYIAAADICLSPIAPLDIYKMSSPTKIFEYMAMCKPIVANEEIIDQKEVIEECKCGILVKFESDSFANGIIRLLNDFDKLENMGKIGRTWVIKNRSYEILAKKVEKVFVRL